MSQTSTETAAAAELEVKEWRARVREILQELKSELDSREPGWRDVLLPLVDETDPFEPTSLRFLLDTAEKHGGLAGHLIGEEVAEFVSDHLDLPDLRKEAECIPWASDALLAHIIGVELPQEGIDPDGFWRVLALELGLDLNRLELPGNDLEDHFDRIHAVRLAVGMIPMSLDEKLEIKKRADAVDLLLDDIEDLRSLSEPEEGITDRALLLLFMADEEAVESLSPDVLDDLEYGLGRMRTVFHSVQDRCNQHENDLGATELRSDGAIYRKRPSLLIKDLEAALYDLFRREIRGARSGHIDYCTEWKRLRDASMKEKNGWKRHCRRCSRCGSSICPDERRLKELYQESERQLGEHPKSCPQCRNAQDQEAGRPIYNSRAAERVAFLVNGIFDHRVLHRLQTARDVVDAWKDRRQSGRL